MPVQGAIATIKKLQTNHELYVITSRPKYLQNKTKKWIHKYFPNMFNNIYYADYLMSVNKSEICKSLSAKTIIEDCLDYALDCANNEIHVFLVNRPWNSTYKNHKNIQRVEKISNIVL